MFYNCSKLNTKIVIRSTITLTETTPSCSGMFVGAGTDATTSPSITVYFTTDTEALVNSMVLDSMSAFITKTKYNGTA